MVINLPSILVIMCWKIQFYQKCCYVDVWLKRSLCIHLETFLLWFLGIILFAGPKKFVEILLCAGYWTNFLVYFLSHNFDHSHFETLLPECLITFLYYLPPTSSYSVSLLLSQTSLPSLLLAEDSWYILSVRESM